MSGDRRGAAIAFVVLLNLLLFALSWATLLSARTAVVTARSGAVLSSLEADAADVLAAGMRRGPGPAGDTAAVGARIQWADTLGGGRVAVGGWTRLGRESWWVRIDLAPGPRDGPGPPVSLARLVWVFDPPARWNDLRGVTAGSGAVPLSPPVPGVPVAVADTLRLGLHDFDDLLGLGIAVGPAGIPQPTVRSGQCDDDDPWSWGDPIGVSACRGRAVVRHASQSVHLLGGVGEGVVLVDGDLTLSGGAQLDGVVLATGRVHVVDGRIGGAIFALGGVVLGPGAVFTPDSVAAVRALSALANGLPGAVPLHPARNLLSR